MKIIKKHNIIIQTERLTVNVSENKYLSQVEVRDNLIENNKNIITNIYNIGLLSKSNIVIKYFDSVTTFK